MGIDSWERTPLRSLGFFVTAVFCTFGGLGFLLDVRSLGQLSPAQLALTVTFLGAVAVAFFLVVRHRWRWRLLPFLLLAQLTAAEAVDAARRSAGAPLEGAALAARLELDALGALVGVLAGYGFFVAFIQREGARRLRLQADVDLARDIHESLVPAVSLRTPRFEVSGAAFPASEVGGDLVDAMLTADGGLTCCILDVSGHGVPAGTLMAALKGALRMRVRLPVSAPGLLADLDAVLRDIRRPNMFATAAALRLEKDGGVSYSLAGHLPVLHWHSATGEITRGAVAGPALGILEDAQFSGTTLAVEAGDLLVLVTDGIVEVVDRRDRELGLAGVEALLQGYGTEPLAELGDRLLQAARAHGPQRDDQTLLLVRALPAAPANVQA